MNVEKIKRIVENTEYDFLRNNEYLNNNIVMLGLGGSYAYGTNNEDSDLDLRGIALNKIEDLLLGNDFEQVVDVITDTTIYSLKKAFTLLRHCNPNTIEILGLSDEQIIINSDIWREIVKNIHIFLSKICELS